jgi:hypothetical protein
VSILLSIPDRHLSIIDPLLWKRIRTSSFPVCGHGNSARKSVAFPTPRPAWPMVGRWTQNIIPHADQNPFCSFRWSSRIMVLMYRLRTVLRLVLGTLWASVLAEIRNTAPKELLDSISRPALACCIPGLPSRLRSVESPISGVFTASRMLAKQERRGRLYRQSVYRYGGVVQYLSLFGFIQSIQYRSFGSHTTRVGASMRTENQAAFR